MTSVILSVGILVLVAVITAIMLLRDVKATRMRERVRAVSTRGDDHEDSLPARTLAIRPAGERGQYTTRLMRLLRFNTDIAQQNVIAWQLVFAAAGVVAVTGFFYGRALLGWQLASLMMPVELLFVARIVFGWERARYQKLLLEQIPEVMAMICRAIAAGIPFGEALRNVARESSAPSRDEFLRVVNEVAIGQSLELALWRMHARVGLPEYAFFAVTIGLQAQTGGSLIETLRNLQELVRARVALSKRGKALAAEARMSATILILLPFAMGLILYFERPGFLNYFFHDPGGNRLLLVTIGLMGTGTFVMRQLIRRSLAP